MFIFIKFMAPEMQMLMEDVLEHVYQGKYKLIQDGDGLICYVEENVHVNTPYANALPDFYPDMFYKFIINIDPTLPPGKMVPAIPVLFFLGDEDSARMTAIYSSLFQSSNERFYGLQPTMRSKC